MTYVYMVLWLLFGCLLAGPFGALVGFIVWLIIHLNTLKPHQPKRK